MKKIGLYGGTFDPIHFGHLNLVMEMIELRGLDEVWLFPAGVNPFKSGKKMTDGQIRCAMTEAAIEPFQNLKVKDLEIRREGVSYAIDTLYELFDLEEEHDYSIIIGDDAAIDFYKWKDVKKIIQMVSILVGRRSCEFELKGLQGDSEIMDALKKGFTETKVFDISATEIRDRISKGLSCHHLVPPKVLDIIYKNDLYS